MTNLDSPKTTIERKEILENKKFLKEVYQYFYEILKKHSRVLPKGKKVEIGSGAGFLKEVIVGVTTSDYLKLPFCDMQFAAEKIPFKDNSVAAFYLLNTFHHIKNPKKALSEMERCLKKKGKIIMIEPANTIFSRFIYKNFHHEDFDEKASWRVSGKGALSDSNQALAYIVFKRDQVRFRKTFPNLKVIKYQNHTPFLYLISGGFKYPSLLPAGLFRFVKMYERSLSLLNDVLGNFTTVVIKKI
jgi:SAM-dependent methyltransferase